jgi:GNAT superfamily N-acetyltransferase
MQQSFAIAYRKLWPTDSPLVLAHFRRLDDAALHGRFLGAGSRARARRHGRALDWTRTVLVGAFAGGRLRGLGELHLGADAESAEIALSVEARFRQLGIGSELLRRLVNAARNRGIHRIHLLCFADNLGMRRMIGKLDGKVRIEAGEGEGAIAPLPPTFATLLEEGLEEGGALLARWSASLRKAA